MAEQEPGNAHLLAIEDFEPAEFAMDDLFEMEEEEEEEPLDPDEIAARQAALEVLLAVQEGDTVEVTRLLDAKPHLLETAKHNMHRTLLMAAAVGGHLDVMKALLGRGADISCTEAMGRTALDLATEEGQTEAMMLLLRSGAEIAGPRRGWGGHRNALTWAASGGHLDCIRLLLEHMRGRGVNIPHTNLYGHTALHQAISRGHVDIARVLLLAGADHTITGSDGMASRRLAYCCSQRQCVPLLEVCTQAGNCKLGPDGMGQQLTCIWSLCGSGGRVSWNVRMLYTAPDVWMRTGQA
jgi:ankyrin repeat protein